MFSSDLFVALWTYVAYDLSLNFVRIHFFCRYVIVHLSIILGTSEVFLFPVDRWS